MGTIPSGMSLTPQGAKLYVVGSSTNGPLRWYTITFPPTAALPTRQLVYGFWSGAKEGYTLRVDAQVIWAPSKPRAALVAPDAAAIVVTSRGVDTHRVTNPATIEKITGIVNALQLYPRGGATSCPADTGADVLSATFHARPVETQEAEGYILPWSGRAYALVVLDGTGCPSAAVTQLSSGTRTTVRGLNAGDAATRVAFLAGLRFPRT